MQYANAKTRQHMAKRKIVGIRETDPVFAKFHINEACANIDEAKQLTHEGYVYWFDGDTLYEGLLYQPWSTKLISDADGAVCNSGINWDYYYATTKEALFSKFPTAQPCDLTYCELSDLYHIGVHYDGRFR